MTIANAFAPGDRVYLSGPISGENLTSNLEKFHELQAVMHGTYGSSVFVANPACLNQDLDYDEMMRRDYAMMLNCTHILMMPGWQTSKGACSELLIAVQIKLKVRYLLSDKETVVKTLLDCNGVKSIMLDTIGETVTCL